MGMKNESDKASWAEHLDWMEGVPAVDAKVAVRSPLLRIAPGLALAAGLAFAAAYLSHASVWPFTTAAGRHPLDAILLAVVLGIVAGNIMRLGDAFKEGVSFTVKKALPVGVILLGARLDFFDFLTVGATGVVLSCLLVAGALGLFAGLTRWWKLPPRVGLLLGVGTAICGGTAIVAVAPVVGAKENEIALSVATVTFVGLIAMFVLPAVAAYTGLDAHTFGIWTGLTIHQTPQVIAAGFAHSLEAGQTATIIKLARVCLLAPVVMVARIWWQRTGGESAAVARPWWRLFPSFVLGFAGLALMRTLGLLPDIDMRWAGMRQRSPFAMDVSIHEALTAASAFLLAISMAGVGLETRLASLRRSSLRAVLAAGLASFILGSAALAAALAVR